MSVTHHGMPAGPRRRSRWRHGATLFLVVSLLGAVLAVPLPAAASHGACVTSDAGLLATVAAKVERHKTTGRKDLVETFGRAYQTMLDQDTYTVSDLKARGDRRNDKWGGDGPNALWQSIYAELDRLEQCRLRHCRAKAVAPQATPPPAERPCAGRVAASLSGP